HTVNTYHRDGAMRIDGNQGGVPGIWPNNEGNWPDSKHLEDPAQNIGAVADRFDFREDDDNYFEQPGNLFRLMSGEKQQLLFENTARNIAGASQTSIDRHIEHCTLADPAYGEGVRKALEAVRAHEASAVEVNSQGGPA